MKTIVFAVAAMLLAAPALAQIESREGIDLQNQILELRQELQNLQQLQSQANGGAPVPAPVPTDNGTPPEAPPGANDAVAGLVVRVASLEEQMRTLQGRVEELANAQQRDHDDLAKQIGDLAFKLGQGGQPGAPPDAGAPGAGAPPPYQGGPASGMDLSAPQPPPPPPPVKHTPEQALRQGSAALARRDYPAAEAAAREVLALGAGPRSGDARYLLANALEGQHQYKDAAASYFAVYKAAPRTPRGAEGLLGVANALIGLSDNKDACQAVAKFSVEFPHADAALKQRAAGARKRAGCK
jgi:TolA-binding protein